MSNRYQKSQALLERALKTIPLGTQTFSKSYLQYPGHASPLYVTHGKGGCVWDVDGNRYVDLVSGLLPVVLGYQDPDVNAAIQAQLQNGISFSLGTELEIQLAEKLVEIIPCAEMVRFGKNGSDATTAAIRLARAFTKRDRIAVCGYHGWHDWYIGATVRDYGIPKCVGALTHRFDYNNIDSLHQLFADHPGEFAAVIMEPMNVVEPKKDFLKQVKDAAHEAGALFILDEIITGFRYDLGGAQSYFNVTPDLATFGKAIANGMPLSVVVGRADIMSLLEYVFISGTFGGETLSMAAALAVIHKMQKEPVIERLWETGKVLVDSVRDCIRSTGLENVFLFSGLSPWMILTVQDFNAQSRERIKTVFMREMLLQGVLIQSAHNVNYAHTQEDIDRVVVAYKNTLERMAEWLNGGALEKALKGPILKPVFSVR